MSARRHIFFQFLETQMAKTLYVKYQIISVLKTYTSPANNTTIPTTIATNNNNSNSYFYFL